MTNIDDVDKKILKILEEDSRTPFSIIARRLNLSESTIHIRIKKLKENGILKRYTVDVDLEKAGKGVTAFVMLKAEPKKYEEILHFLQNMREVYEIYDVTGEYYAIIKVRVENREILAKVLDEIGNQEGIVNTYTMFVLRTLKDTRSIDP